MMMEISRVTGFQIDLGRSEDCRYEIRVKDNYVDDHVQTNGGTDITWKGEDYRRQGMGTWVRFGLVQLLKIILDTQVGDTV